jgi:uncharacterized membrane protein
MAPFIVLVVAIASFLILGRLGVPPLRPWRTALRWALALMFLFTAAAHFGPQRPDLVRMVPPVFAAPELLVTVTGVLQVLGALGLLIPRTAPGAAVGLALLMVALFPANVYAAREAMTIGGRAVVPLVPRALLQLIFIAALVVSALRPGKFQREVSPGRLAHPKTAA